MKTFWNKYKTILVILLVLLVAAGVFFGVKAKRG